MFISPTDELAPWCRHIFGCRGDLQDGLHQLDDQDLLYAAGRSVVLFNMESRAQRFIGGSQDTEYISALAITPSRKYVAVAERSEKGTVTVYDLQTLKRRKVLTSSESSAKGIASISFSSDGIHLAVQGSSPEWILTVWAWERAKLLGSIRTANNAGEPVHQVHFSPGGSVDPNILTAVGQGVFKVFRAEDMGLRIIQHSLSKRDSTHFTCHAWITNDRMAVGTELGDLHICDSTELKATVHGFCAGEAITALAQHIKGLIATTAQGSIYLLEKLEDGSHKTSFRHQLDSQGPIRSTLSLSEDAFALLSSNGQLFRITLTSERNKEISIKAEPLGSGVCTGEMLGMSGCLRKPLIATSGTDRTLRLWNFKDRLIELEQTFPDESFGISMHPLGLLAAVGFADKLRLFMVLLDGFRCVKELPIRSCQTVVFSHGGHLFVAANGSTMSVYSTFTCEQLGVLRGHSGKVRATIWSGDDTFITSAGADGAIYEWDLKDFKRSRENVSKGCNYCCLARGALGGTTYAAGSGNKLRAFDHDSTVGLKIVADVDAGCAINQIAVPSGGRLLFAATSKGTVRTYRLPLSQDFQELHCSSSPITQLALSHSFTHLYASSSEGLLFVFAVKDRDPSRLASRDTHEDQLPWSDEVLLSTSSIEEKHQRIASLESQVAELDLAREYALRVKELAAQEDLAAQAARHAAELEGQRNLWDQRRQQIEALLAERERLMHLADEKHQAQLTAIESHCQARLDAASQEASRASTAAAQAAAAGQKREADLEAAYIKLLETTKEDAAAAAEAEKQAIAVLSSAKESQERDFALWKEASEEVTDQEIEELKARYEVTIAAERENGVRLIGENGVMRSKFAALTTQLKEKLVELKLLQTSKQEAEQVSKVLEAEVSRLQDGIKENLVYLAEKKSSIAKLGDEVQGLVKDKLEMQQKLLNAEEILVPKDNMIADQQKQIKGLQAELEKGRKRVETLDLSTSSLRQQQAAARKDISRHVQLHNSSQAAIRSFQADLQDAVRLLQDPDALRSSVKELFRKHASDTSFEAADTNTEDVKQRLEREKSHLEGTIQGLKLQLKKATDQKQQDKLLAVKEQDMLLTEIEKLRQREKRVHVSTKAPRLSRERH